MGGEGRGATLRGRSSKCDTLFTPPGSQVPLPTRRGRYIADTYAVYEKRRANGMRVTARFLRVAMRRSILDRHGEEVASSFRASHRWLHAFARRHHLSLRRKTNCKHMPVEARLAKCKRWHARFRRRLRHSSTTRGFTDEDGGESAFESEDDDFGEVYGSPIGSRDGVQAEGLQTRMREASTHEVGHMGEGPTNVSLLMAR